VRPVFGGRVSAGELIDRFAVGQSSSS